MGFSFVEDTRSLKTVFQAGDILFGKLRAYLRKTWLAGFDGLCSTEIWALAPNRTFADPRFLGQLVRTDRLVEAASTAYGTHMPRSDWKVVQAVSIQVPSIAEQAAIAEVLTDMDDEIEALKARRDKTQALKQGMMQELLSGRVRLV